MSTRDPIDLSIETQVLFNEILRTDEKSIYYIKDCALNFKIVSPSFLSLLKIPLNFDLNKLPKIESVRLTNTMDDYIFNSKIDGDFILAFPISLEVKKLFVVRSHVFYSNDIEYIFSSWKLFSSLNDIDRISNIIGINERRQHDFGFPIDDYENLIPTDLSEEGDWYIIWLLIKGESIRWIADFLNESKKSIENKISKFYKESGIFNKKNLMSVAIKYNWIDFIDDKTLKVLKGSAAKVGNVVF